MPIKEVTVYECDLCGEEKTSEHHTQESLVDQGWRFDLQGLVVLCPLCRGEVTSTAATSVGQTEGPEGS